jgi:hypothetical protein
MAVEFPKRSLTRWKEAPLRRESGSFSRRYRPVTARTFGALSGRTETLKTKTGLSIVAVTRLSSLRDELPEFQALENDLCRNRRLGRSRPLK